MQKRTTIIPPFQPSGTMAAPTPGLITIFCRACLDNPRSVASDDEHGIIDALFFTSRIMNHSSMVSSVLRFCRRRANIHEGVYDISANASRFTFCPPNSSLQPTHAKNLRVTQVVAYHELDGTKVTKENKEMCKLMGDIVDVCFNFLMCSYPILSTYLFLQFKPVAVSAEDPVGACKIPARITGSGTVFSVDKEKHSFMMFPTLTISSSEKPETLPVRGLLEKGPRWPNPTARLPSPQSLVAFTGKLAFFEDRIGKPHAELTSQAVVTLDTIIYLRTSSGPSVSPRTPSVSQRQDADTIALKSRVLKYTRNLTAKQEEDCMSTSSRTATSQEDDKIETEV